MFALRNFQTHAQTHTYTLNTHIENDLLIPSTTVADERNKNRSKDIMITPIMDALTFILELRY